MQHKTKSLSILDGFLIMIGTFVLVNVGQLYCRDLLNSLISLLPGGLTDMNRLLMNQLLQSTIMISLIFFFLFGIRRSHFHAIGLVQFREMKWLPVAVLSGVTLYFFMMLLLGILTALFPQLAQPQAVTETISDAHTLWEMAAALFAVGILAPVSEELLFRGYIYHSLRQSYPVQFSIFMTSLLFSCMHYDLLRFFPLFIVGVFLNIICVKSESLYGSMVMHSAWNVFMALSIFID